MTRRNGTRTYLRFWARDELDADLVFRVAALFAAGRRATAAFGLAAARDVVEEARRAAVAGAALAAGRRATEPFAFGRAGATGRAGAAVRAAAAGRAGDAAGRAGVAARAAGFTAFGRGSAAGAAAFTSFPSSACAVRCTSVKRI